MQGTDTRNDQLVNYRAWHKGPAGHKHPNQHARKRPGLAQGKTWCKHPNWQLTNSRVALNELRGTTTPMLKRENNSNNPGTRARSASSQVTELVTSIKRPVQKICGPQTPKTTIPQMTEHYRAGHKIPLRELRGANKKWQLARAELSIKFDGARALTQSKSGHAHPK
jgi:hypothetical protein